MRAIVVAAMVVWGGVGLGEANASSSPTLPVIPPELASYDPRGGRNLAEQVQVNPTTGDLSYWETDLAFPETAWSPVLQRFYQSTAPNKEAGMFGRGWRTVFERRLIALNPETYVLADEWGRTCVFSKQKDGRWWAEQGPAARIEPGTDAMTLHEDNGRSWRFDSAGRLAAIGSPTGQRLTIGRDRKYPMVVRDVQGAGGLSLSFEMNNEGLVERVASADGRSVAYVYRQGLLVATRTERGAGSRYAYDSAGRLAEAEMSNGSLLVVRSDARGRVVGLSGRGIPPRTYTVGPVDNPRVGQVGNLSHPGSATQWRTVEGGRRLEMDQGEGNKAVLETTERGTPARLALGEKLAWQWQYDERGRLIAVVGPQGETSRFTYAGEGLEPVRIERADGIRLGIAPDEKGRPATVAVGNFRPWRCEYDETGRLSGFEDFSHGRTEIGYDPKGRIASVGKPSGAKAAIGRDEKGRITSVRENGGVGLGFERDAQGRVRRINDGVESLDLDYNDSANVTWLRGSQGYERRLYYTAEGLVSVVQAADGRNLRLFYDSERHCFVVHHGDGSGLQLVRDRANRIETIEAIRAGTRWTATYGAWGRPLRYQKQGYPPARTDCDAEGRVKTLESPGGRWAFDYTPSGRLAGLDTPLRRYRFAEDPLGRLQSVVEAASARRDTFEYDAANRLVKRSTPGWSEQYRYDRAGRLAGLVVTGLDRHEYVFEYNEAGWLETIRYPNGVRTIFDYDAAHRITRANSRDTDGRVLLTAPADYTTGSRLAAATGAGSNRFAYRYDSNLALVETVWPDGHRDSFSYDARGGLASATRGGRRETMVRDSLGRPTEIGVRRYLYVRPDEATTPKTTATVCLILDDRERVAGLNRNDGLKARYDYLPDGRMIRREVAGRVVAFDWDGPRLRAILDESGQVQVSIHYDPVFGLPLAVVMGRQTYFCHPDVFGHPALLTDEKGRPADAPRDFPFELKDEKEPRMWPTWEGLPPAIRLPEEGLLLVRGSLFEPRSGNLLSPDLSRFLESENPYRVEAIPRPLDPTLSRDELVNALRWIEEIEKQGFEQRRSDGCCTSEEGLAELAALVCRPELLERRLLRAAFRHDFSPDRWFDPMVPEGMPGEFGWLTRGPLAPPSSPADFFNRFSPLGPTPYPWPRAAQTLEPRVYFAPM